MAINGTRNLAIWETVLAPVRQYLLDNPKASAADAARQFNMPKSLVAKKLCTEFDWKARRAARGEARRAKRAPKQNADVVNRAIMAKLDEVLAEVKALRKEFQ